MSGPVTYVCPRVGCGYSIPVPHGGVTVDSVLKEMAEHVRGHVDPVAEPSAYDQARTAFGSDGPELQHQLAAWLTKKQWGKRINPDLVAQALKRFV